MSKLTIEIDEDMLNDLFIKFLKNHMVILQQDFKSAWHPEDKKLFIQVHAACLTLLEWMSKHTDFEKFMEEQYGSKADQGE